MRICWDTYGLYSENSGIYSYGLNYAKSLKKLGMDLELFSYRTLPQELLLHTHNHKVESFWAAFAGSKLIEPALVESHMRSLFSNDACVLHGLSNINLSIFHPRNPKWRYVVTIHDLIPLICPEGVSLSQRWHYRILLPKVLKKSHAIICPSKWTAQTIQSYFPTLDHRKVHVIPNGFVSGTTIEKRQKTDTKIQMLFVGRNEVYKRLSFVQELCNELLLRNVDFSFHVVSDSSAKDLFKNFNSTRVHFYQGISQTHLESLYKTTDFLLMPSLFEGFGLPLLEANMNGARALYTRGSAMDEIALPNFGIAMDRSSSPKLWADKIIELNKKQISDEDVKLAQQTLEDRFSWDDSAQELLKLYRSLF